MNFIIQLMEKLIHKSWRQIFNNWKWIFSYMKKYWLQIFIFTSISAFSTITGLISSIVSKNLIDAVTGFNSGVIGYAAAAYVGLGVGRIFLNILTGRISLLVTTKVSNELSADIFKQLIYTDWESISEYTTGDLLVRLSGDTANISSNILNFIPNAVNSFINFGGAFLILLMNDPIMAVIALAGAPVTFLTSRYRMEKMISFQKESQQMRGKSMSFHQQTFQNLQSIKAFGVLGHFTDELKNIQQEFLDLSLRQYHYQAWTNALMSLVSLAVSYSCYGFAVYRLWQGNISYGTMTLFVSMAGSLTGSFQSVLQLLPTMVRTSTSAERLLEIINLDREDFEISDHTLEVLTDCKEKGAHIHVSDVSFHYKNGRNVYENVSMEAHPGEIIGLIGPSGKGKTTCLRMLLGLIKPQSGHVQIGSDKELLNVSSQTRCFYSYVPQNNTMFYGTIEENLRMIKPDVTEEEMIQALKMAQAWEFVEQLPDGIRSDIGEQGHGFSEGQKQRLSIARALIADTPVILLDEATSALDTDTEQKILDQIMKKDEKKIMIVTAHRPSVYKLCDRVYVIEKHKITQQ